MDSEIAEQILEEIVPTFENLETQSLAIAQLLKEKGLVNDDELAPHLERAASASSVRWRAIRLRMQRLLTLAEKSTHKPEAPEKVNKGEGKSAGDAGKAGAREPQSKKDQRREPEPGDQGQESKKSRPEHQTPEPAGSVKSSGQPVDSSASSGDQPERKTA